MIRAMLRDTKPRQRAQSRPAAIPEQKQLRSGFRMVRGEERNLRDACKRQKRTPRKRGFPLVNFSEVKLSSAVRSVR